MPGFGVKKKNKKEAKRQAQQVQPKKVKKNVDKSEKIGYGENLNSNQFVSEDRGLNRQIVLDTYVEDDGLNAPCNIDMFVCNTIQLAKIGTVLPWLPDELVPDPLIDEAIRGAKTAIGPSDIMKDTGVIDINSSRKVRSLEVR
ncbi:hypothetical protein [Clostridium paraputrificum]|uniref:Uncharacterized protein n=1 Tax=Clostridium paraputrificum TaxID=29363 RepID=A0A6N3EYJ9_9CLOT